jgi:hypothetical protein
MCNNYQTNRNYSSAILFSPVYIFKVSPKMPDKNFLSKTYLTSEHKYVEWRQTRIHLRISQVHRAIFPEELKYSSVICT